MASPHPLSLLSLGTTLVPESLAADSLHPAAVVSAITSSDAPSGVRNSHTRSPLNDHRNESVAWMAGGAEARPRKKKSPAIAITRGRAASGHSPYTFAMSLSRLKHMPSDAAETNTINHV